MTYATDDVIEFQSGEVLLHDKNIAMFFLYKHLPWTTDELVGNLKKS